MPAVGCLSGEILCPWRSLPPGLPPPLATRRCYRRHTSPPRGRARLCQPVRRCASAVCGRLGIGVTGFHGHSLWQSPCLAQSQMLSPHGSWWCPCGFIHLFPKSMPRGCSLPFFFSPPPALHAGIPPSTAPTTSATAPCCTGQTCRRCHRSRSRSRPQVAPMPGLCSPAACSSHSVQRMCATATQQARVHEQSVPFFCLLSQRVCGVLLPHQTCRGGVRQGRGAAGRAAGHPLGTGGGPQASSSPAQELPAQDAGLGHCPLQPPARRQTCSWHLLTETTASPARVPACSIAREQLRAATDPATRAVLDGRQKALKLTSEGRAGPARRPQCTIHQPACFTGA